MVLIKFLEKNCRKGRFCPSKLRGKRAIELGAGCGLAGFGLALLGCHVVSTDQIEVLPLLMKNVERNTSWIRQAHDDSEFGSIEVAERNEDHTKAVGPPFDFIIGTDVELLQKEVTESSSETEAFIKVSGKEHPGRVRGMGIGVIPSQVCGPTFYSGGSSSSLSSADAKIEKLEAEVSALKAQLAFLMQTLNGNRTTNFESPREPRQSSSFSHVPEDHGPSSSDAH